MFLVFYNEAVECGFPSPARDFTEGSIDLNEELIPHPNSTFVVRARGDSMIGSGIYPDDLVIVDRSLNPHQLLVLMVLLTIILGFLLLMVLRNQIKPIKTLASAAEAFGKGQSLAYKPTGSIEIRKAGSAFLEMRKRLERQIEQRTQMLIQVI